MLLDPEQGPRMADLVTAETFAMALRATYAPGRQPSDAELADAWGDGARAATDIGSATA